MNGGAGLIETSIKALLKIISMALGKKDLGRKGTSRRLTDAPFLCLAL